MGQTREKTCGAPLDTILFASAVVEVGKSRIWPGHPCFHDSGPIQRRIVAFPGTLVRIEHEGQKRFIAGLLAAGEPESENPATQRTIAQENRPLAGSSRSSFAVPGR